MCISKILFTIFSLGANCACGKFYRFTMMSKTIKKPIDIAVVLFTDEEPTCQFSSFGVPKVFTKGLSDIAQEQF